VNVSHSALLIQLKNCEWLGFVENLTPLEALSQLTADLHPKKTDKITIAPESKPSLHIKHGQFRFFWKLCSSFLPSYRTLTISKRFFVLFCFLFFNNIFKYCRQVNIMCQKTSSLRSSLKPKRKTQTVLSLHFRILVTCIFCRARIWLPVIQAILVIKYFSPFKLGCAFEQQFHWQ